MFGAFFLSEHVILSVYQFPDSEQLGVIRYFINWHSNCKTVVFIQYKIELRHVVII